MSGMAPLGALSYAWVSAEASLPLALQKLADRLRERRGSVTG
jgi:hypothetical protein